jgi:Tfp pilus assembly protein PilF
VALARAQLATGDRAGARDSIDKALAMPLKNAQLFAVAAAVYAANGDTTRAGEFDEQARGLDPRIDGPPDAATSADAATKP